MKYVILPAMLAVVIALFYGVYISQFSVIRGKYGEVCWKIGSEPATIKKENARYYRSLEECYADGGRAIKIISN